MKGGNVIQLNLCVILIYCSGLSYGFDFPSINTSKRLTDHLLSGYKSNLSPYLYNYGGIKAEKPIVFHLQVLKLDHVDELLQTISFNGMTACMWTDPGLSWKYADFDNILHIDLPHESIWKPPIGVDESSSSGLNVLFRDDFAHGLSTVYYEGTVSHISAVQVVFSCPLDMRKFPFDQHHCPLDFKFNWGFGYIGQLELVHMPPLDRQANLGEWAIDISEGRLFTKTYDWGKGYQFNDTNVRFDFHLRRHSTYYQGLFMTPAVLMAILVPLIFVLPPESPQKLNLGGTILICVFLLFVMLDATIPAAQESMPIIGLYYVAVLVLVTLSIAVSILVGNIWAMQRRKKVMPYYLRKIFIDTLGRFLFTSYDPYWQDNAPMSPNVNSMEVDVTSVTKVTDVQVDNEGSIAGEWRQLALAIDRIFMILFFFIVFMLSACIMTL